MSFSRLWIFLAILFLISGLPAAAQPIHLLTAATGGIKGSINADFNVSEEQMLSVPVWRPESEPPPLDFAQALKIAQNWRQLRGETMFRLSGYSVCSHGARWYYSFQFLPQSGAAPLRISDAIVLMNGIVVKPILSIVVHSQSTPGVFGTVR